MPLTSQERSEKYRAKQKLDPLASDQLKERDRQRKQLSRLVMGPKERLIRQEIDRQRKRDKRAAQRAAMKGARAKPTPDPPLATPNPNPFPTPASLGKAVQRARKNLPKSPTKGAQVIASLASNLTPNRKGMIVEAITGKPQHERKKRADALTQQEIEEVKRFFNRDDISRMSPGKKDYVTVRLENGVKERRQKRTLIVNLSEAHSLFCEESEMSIHLSKFCTLRPEHVIPISMRDQEVCMCKYHENLDLLALGIRKVVANFPCTGDEVVKHTVCSMTCRQCIDRECDNCSDTQGLYDVDVSYHQWETQAGIFTKVLHNSDMSTVRDMLKEQLKGFSRHVYDAKRQHQELRHLKDNLSPGSIVVHEDFSENYTLKHQNEVMSGHWSQSSVTLFTVIVYYREREGEELQHISYVVTSDELTHGKTSVYHFNSIILMDIRKKLPWELLHVHFWSDGAASQFKNKFNFDNLLSHVSDFCCTADWSYFATSHGKGPIDGIGGEVKRQVWRAVLQGKVVVSNAIEFYEEARKLCSKIVILFASKEDIEDGTRHLPERWDTCTLLPGTQSYHFIRPTSFYCLQYGRNSTFSNPHEVLLTKMMKECNENLPEVSSGSTSTEVTQPVKTGDFVVVELERSKGKKRSTRRPALKLLYLSQVINMSGDSVDVTFLKYSGSAKNIFAYPSLEDNGSVYPNEIVRKVPVPSMDTRGRYIFTEDIIVSK